MWYELQKKRKGQPYDAQYAKHVSYVRMRAKRKEGKKIALNRELREFVEAQLLDDQSPEGIAGRLRSERLALPAVSAFTIRQYIKSVYGRGLKFTGRKCLRKEGGGNGGVPALMANA